MLCSGFSSKVPNGDCMNNNDDGGYEEHDADEDEDDLEEDSERELETESESSWSWFLEHLKVDNMTLDG
ncbi:hypothetical protein Tco_0990406 [Tanacetum coccineum]|uniref:Uncharacterized protein n=1 Tax=Tanacetum coccineum TaxID=301880 RepID=A0ABQ5EWR2_9ASTR